MRNRIRSSDPALLAVLAAVALSLGFWALVLLLDFHLAPKAYKPENYKTYFELINWSPYPFMFLALAPAIWLTWRPFMRAWAHLAETGVLTGPDKQSIDNAVEAVQKVAGRWRFWALVWSLVVAVIVNYLDLKPRIDIYGDSSATVKKLERACKNPNAFKKWLFDTHIEGVKNLCDNEQISYEYFAAESATKPAQFDSLKVVPPRQLLFVYFAFVQQFSITFFVALLLFQVLSHTLIFYFFERLALAPKYGVRLNLNCRSPLNEFGLEHWNHALNNFYWSVCPAMLGVFLSRAATSPKEYAFGQQLLGMAVPAILLVPMILTVLVRQARLPDAWSALQTKGPAYLEDFRRQQLWPLDRNWATKLGIVLAFALAALALGFEFSRFVKL